MALLQQGGQVTNLTSQQAANQAAQNFPGPNQPFSPQYGAMNGGYIQNTAQYPGGYPGYQPMGGNMGLFPMGNQLQGTIVYATVVNGEPIILDPESGEVLPPGYVPDIDNPNTYEGWRPGDSWTETMDKAVAQWNEDVRQAIENAVRPAEEKFANSVADGLKTGGRELVNTGNKIGPVLQEITPGEGEYQAPENAMQQAQKRANEMYSGGGSQMMQPVSAQQQMRTMQSPNLNRPISQPIQSGGQTMIMSR